MSGPDDTSENVPLNTRRATLERSYGGTFTTDRVSTSHLASSGDSRAGNARHVGGRDDSGPLHPMDNVPQLQRQDSSMTVRMNAVEDGAGALRRGIKLFTFSLVADVFLIVIGTVVLGLHWGDKPVVCNSSSSADDGASINDVCCQWLLVAVILKVLITSVCVVRWKLEEPSEHNEADARAVEGVLEFLNFIQYVWSFSGLQMLLSSRSCDHRSDSPIYQLCLAFIVVFFVPIVLITLMALALCFCLPSTLGALQQLSLQRSGARQEEIDRLPIVKFSQHEPVEESCAICLVDYDNDDDLRKLPCSHALHQSCVDSWLAVNASCPICRAPCITAREEETDTAESAPFGEGFV